MLPLKLNNPVTIDRPEKTMPLLANGIMLLILFYLLSQLGTQIFYLLQPDTETATLTDTVSTEKPGKPTSNTGHNIASMHLFGQAVSKKELTAKKQIIAPETKLNLTLRGILVETDKQQGHAIIQNNDTAEEQFFTIDKAVFDLATLKEIYRDRVILLHNDKYETLYLPKEALSREHFSNSASIASERKAAANDLRKTLLKGDGDELNELFGFDTSYKNGSFIGFTVKTLGEKGRQMMELFGVEEGDLITVINGMRLSESLEAFEKIKELKTATSVDIIIDRNGNEIPFHFELDTPAEEPPTFVEQTTSQLPTQSTSIDMPGIAEPVNPTDISRTDGSDNLDTEIDEEDEDLGDDWDESQEAIEFAEQQRTRATGIRNDVVFDH